MALGTTADFAGLDDLSGRIGVEPNAWACRQQSHEPNVMAVQMNA
jgi:hypothetical protein